MLAGSNAEIQIFTRSQTRDASGSLITSWVCSAHKVAAMMQTNSGAENVRAGAERSDFRGTGEVAAYIDVAQGDRIVWAGRTLQVDAAHTVYRFGDIPDRNRFEWSEVTGAGL